LLDEEGCIVGSSFRGFVEDFKTSSFRGTVDRAMRVNEGEDQDLSAANDYLLSKCTGLHPAGSLLFPLTQKTDVAYNELSSALKLSNFGIKRNTTHSSLEKAGLWCGRLTMHGVRQVAMVKHSEIQRFMRSSGIAGVDAKTYFRDIREEGIK